MKFPNLILPLLLILTFSSRFSFSQETLLNESIKAEVEQNLAQAEEKESSGDYNQAALYYSKTATTYWVNGISDKAIGYFNKAVEMNEKIGNQNAIRTIYNNIGMIYTDNEDFPNALLYFEKSLVISKKMNRKGEVASTLINIANIHVETGTNKKALAVLEEANILAKELNDPKLLRNTYSLLSDVYNRMGDNQKSAEYFSLYTSFTRKIQKDEIQKKEAEAKHIVNEATNKVREIESQKELTEKELEIKIEELETTEQNLQKVQKITTEQQLQIDLLSKEKELQDATIKNQKLVRNIFIAIIIGVFAFTGLLVQNILHKKRANKLLEQQNIEIAEQRDMIEQKGLELVKALGQIEKQNKDITSSINYAHRIQQALLPSEANLTSILPDSFIFIQPRDIVSGDFYWFTGYKGKHIQKSSLKNFITLENIDPDECGLIITAADCTGHGVPGAFMSMIGFNLLETISRNGITKPDEMLNVLHQSIRYLLKQYDSDNRDGMDMAVCVIKDNGRRVEFAGAKNPLCYIKNGELEYIKGDPVPVGGLQKELKRVFTINTIDVDAPTCFYLFSDGFIDQFGGESGEKFSSKRFKELLLEIHQRPMPEQKMILSQKLDDWKGLKYKAVDDILVIGFKLWEKEMQLCKS